MRFPTKFDIHEYHIMEEFVRSLPEGRPQDILEGVICWRGAFRRFKDTVYEFGLEKRWFQYKSITYSKIAVNIKNIKMNDTLRRSKEINPVIILVNDMFTKPFVINGNHRVVDAFKKRANTIEAYVINSDDVSECLITVDYKKAYLIFKQLYRLIGSKIDC